MARYIDADALLKKQTTIRVTYHCQGADEWDDYEAVLVKDINNAPTISPDDVRGVGEWIETAMPSGWYDVTCAECSVCGEDFMLGDYCMDDVRDLFHYCPNCGARMSRAEAEKAMEVNEDA